MKCYSCTKVREINYQKGIVQMKLFSISHSEQLWFCELARRTCDNLG